MREREARLWFAVIAVSGMLVAGCTSPDEPAAEETSPSGAANSQDRGEALRPQDQLRRLEPAPAANVVGLIDEQGGVTRAGNEHTLVVWHPPNDFDHVFYRIYDRAWTPVTDLLEVRVGLEVVRGLRSSFLARATACNRNCSRNLLNEWVVIGSDGGLRRIPQQAGRYDLEPGDLRARTSFAHGWALRPRTGKVVELTPGPWGRSRGFNPYVNDRGAVCFVPGGSRSGDPVFTSIDDGLHWRRVGTRAIDAVDGNPRLQSCETAAERVVVMTGREYPEHMSVLDRTSGTLVSRIRLGDRLGDSPFSGYGWVLLPDGRLVFDARRRGLLVATDATNQQFVFRSGPVADVVDGELIDWVGARNFLTVSKDAGKTWSRVDLAIPRPE
jgi:hypothetical protein